MKNLIYLTITLITLASCGASTPNTDNVNQVKIPYKIVSEVPNTAANKCNIDIELQDKASKKDLETIANELRATRATYDKLWIFYYLPGMQIGSGAWATTHFMPDLKVEILGPTREEETKVKESAGKIDGNILGEFYEEKFSTASYTVYEKGNKTCIKIVYSDGSSSNNDMKCKNTTKGIRLDYKDGSSNGEYFVLTEADILEFYNAEGKKITEAAAIK